MEAISESKQLTEQGLDALMAPVVRALHEATNEFDGDWRQVGGGRQTATITGAHSPFLQPWATLRDRDEGRYLPFYEHESDLRTIRAKSRNLATFTSIAVGAIEALQAYTIGGEWQYEAVTREGVHANSQLLALAQRVVDDALERNEFQGTLDEAIHKTAREDGEALTAVYHCGGGNVNIELIDADCLREPANGKDIDRALGATEFIGRGKPTSWTFGVHNIYNPVMRRINYAHAVGYHCVFDETGREWDYLPAFPQQFASGSRLGGKCLIHLKMNVPPAAKRGLSDFYPIQEVLERNYILGRNLAVGAAIQAAIAYIREHAGNTTRDGVVSQLSTALDSLSRAATASRTDGKTQNNFPPGTVIDTSALAKYHAGPLGELRSPVFVEICAFLSRCVGVRWLMPEYIISGDASNANYASTLVSESPFVKAREADQRRFAAHFKRILWAALKIAFDAGRFGASAATWQEFRSLVDLRVKAPPVASRDKTQVLDESTRLYDLGMISANELLTDLQREPRPGWDDKFAEPTRPQLPPVGASPVEQAAISAALESVRSTSEARAILESFREGDEADSLAAGERWITINGNAVKIRTDGEILTGAMKGKFVGKLGDEPSGVQPGNGNDDGGGVAGIIDAMVEFEETGFEKLGSKADINSRARIASALKRALSDFPHVKSVELTANSAGSMYFDVIGEGKGGDEVYVKVRASNHKAKPNSHTPSVWSFEVGDDEKSIRRGIAAVADALQEEIDASG